MAHRLVVGVFLCLLSLVSAASQGQTVALLDEQGAPALVLLDADTVRVRVVDPAGNTGPGRDSVAVTVTSDLAGDSQALTLLETGLSTGIFEGAVKLYPLGSYEPPLTPALATTNRVVGQPSRDTVRATYPGNGAMASAGLEGSILQFVDEWGRLSPKLVAGQSVILRVRDQLRNSPHTRDSFDVVVSSMYGPTETVTVRETAVNSAVFEGVLQTRRAGSSGTGLPVQTPDLVTATLLPADGVVLCGVQTQTMGSQVLLLDTEGEPVEAYLEGERVRVRVIDPTVLSGSVTVQVAAALTGDTETLTLIQTAAARFEGEIPTRLIYWSSPTPGDGTLQITGSYVPEETDTVTVSYPDGSNAPFATAPFLSGRISFVDAEGEVTSAYAQGTEIHVRLESPGLYGTGPGLDTAIVQLTNLTWGNQTTLELLETSPDSSVFTGSIPLEGSSMEGTPFAAEAGNQLRVRGDSVFGEDKSPEAFAEISPRSLQFLDEWGEPTDEIVESSPARVRMFSTTDAVNSWTTESVTIQMRGRLTGDLETLTLTETGPDTDVFEGSIPLETSSSTQADGTLQTVNGGQPDYHQDEVMASAGEVEATARTVGARIDFVDAQGQRVDRFVLGETVRVRIVDPYQPSVSSFILNVVSLQTGDVEGITMQRTAPGSSLFTGSIATALVESAQDGKLGVTFGEQIEVRHMTGFSPIEITKRAEILGSAVSFLDAAGRPATVFLESSRAYVRVQSVARNLSPQGAEAVQVELRAMLSQDWETLTLSETGPDTGIFEGSIKLQLARGQYPQQTGNGVLETTEVGGSYGSPHRFDTLRAAFIDGFKRMEAEAQMTGSRVWFADSADAEVLEFPIGGRAYVRVEDHNANATPEAINYAMVEVRSAVTNDFESLQLLETGPDTGIFAGSLPLPPSGAPAANDGALQVQPAESIEALHQDAYGATASSAVALIQESSVEIIDKNGEPTETVLQGGEVRVRVYRHFGNTNPAQAESVTVTLQSLYGNDTQVLELVETGPNTSVFEGAMPLYTYASPNPVGLRTSYSPYPEGLEDRVTASMGPVSDEARVTGLRIIFLDAFGRETTTYAVGEAVRVRVEDHVRNSSPSSQDTNYLYFRSSTGDMDSLPAQETGPNTAIFEVSVPTVLWGSGSHDGQLRVDPGGTVSAEAYPQGAPDVVTIQASITGNAVLFLDAAGQPATEYLEGSRAYLRVISAISNTSGSTAQTVSVEVTSELEGDVELVTLTETGLGTGVFEGSIPIALQNASFFNDGILQTYEEGGPPHRFDTVRATFLDPAGTSVARIGLTGSRTWFVDAAGNQTLSYPVGGTVRLRVEAPSRNNAWQYDFTNVRVRSLVNNDVELVRVQETARDSGIFTGSLPTSAEYDAVAIDGLLRVQTGEQIEAEHEDLLGFTASSAIADIATLSIEILDSLTGTSGVLLEKGSARVRVFSLGNNANPGQADSLEIELSSRYGSDTEMLTLTETGPDTDLFEGVLPLDIDRSMDLPGSLRTSYSEYPEMLEDQVTATYDTVSARARVTGVSLVFLDVYGRETTSYAAGESVRVRVVDHNRNSNATTIDTHSMGVDASTGDRESIELRETGFNTSVFEGTMATVLSGGSTFNGQLLVAPGGTVTATIYPYNGNGPFSVSASVTGNAVRFVDAAGQPAASYLESSRAYLEVFSASRNTSSSTVETVSVQLHHELGDDAEVLTLTETGASTGLFRGSIALRLAAYASPGDGVLQTHQIGGPPHEYDTLRATFSDPSGTSVARIGLTGSRVWFVDATGAEVSSYPVGGTARVRVEDQNLNTPGQWDFLQVRLRSLTSLDEETVTLQETSRESGVFAGSLPLAVSGPQSAGDGRLLAQAGERIEALHDEVILQAKATAVIDNLAIWFLDAAGEPTSTLLEKGTARVRVFNVFATSTLEVELSSLYGADTETLTLTETAPGSHVFEGVLPLDIDRSSDLPGSLRTSYSEYPEMLEDQVTATYDTVSARARVDGVSLVFLDAYGRETTSYAAGESVRVRVVDHNRNSNTTTIDTHYMGLDASTGDRESIELRETGFNTSVFEGTMVTVLSGGSTFNGQLLVAPGGTVEASIYPYNGDGPFKVAASITGSAVHFVDAAGQPAASYLESSRAYLEVASALRNTSSSTVQTVTVQLNNELGADAELVTLTETGVDTGLFRGSIALRRSSSVSPGDGVLQTQQIAGPPHEYDTLRATFSDPSGTSVARIGLTGSRVWFVDATGAEVSSYPVGGTARVRVEDQNLNTPGQWDFLQVRLRSLTSLDEETVTLQETSRESGVFAGSLPLAVSGPQSAGDGRLLAQAGERIEALHDEVILQAKATAVIDNLAIWFLDAAGEPTSALLEKGTARVRVFNVFASSTLEVELSSLYGSDTETLTLTETAPNSHVFEGVLPLDTDRGSDLPGSLRTSYSEYPEMLEDQVTATYDTVSARALVRGVSLVFLDSFGRETTSYAAGESVQVRVVDHNRNSYSTQVDTLNVNLDASTGDRESLELRETGFNTSVFEGTMGTVLSGGSLYSGQLLVAPGGTVEASIYPYNGDGPFRVAASITGHAVRFIDAAGQPAASYLESSRAYLEVNSPLRNTSSSTVQTLTAQLENELGGDSELVTLTETGVNTGLFRGSIALRRSSAGATPGDGVLQTHQLAGPPHEYDTLRATFSDPSGTSVARIGLTGSRVWFVDATGAEVSSYPVGGTARVRVEDQNLNTPGQWDFLQVRLRSLTSLDEETVTLQETSRESGVFAGSLPLGVAPPHGIGDGRLLATAGERIEAIHDEVILQRTATAVLENLEITFIDAAGEPTATLLDRGTARVRVFSVFASSTLEIELSSLYGSDTETLTLTETAPGSHVFEGALPLDRDRSVDLPGSLRTSYSEYPEMLEDQVTATYGAVSAQARVVGLSLVFLDSFGRETTSFAAGESVRVRVVDYNRNLNATNVDMLSVQLEASTGDRESLDLQETGENTSVFEGSMPTVLSAGATYNGQLQVAPGGTLEASVYPYDASGPLVVEAAITGHALLFVDAAGQPAASYLESSRAYLRMISPLRNTSSSTVETVTVQLNNELGADAELVTLTETGAGTGVFAGSIPLRYASVASPGDGVLQTHQVSGPPHEYDTLRATYADPSGTSVARIGLTGSRTWFTNAQGVEALSFPANARVYVRVEDHNFDTPGVIDQTSVWVRSLSTQDEEMVALTETGTDTGLFVGSLPLSGPPASLGDGRLLVQVGEQIEAEHEDAGGFTASSAVADVTVGVNQAPTPVNDTATTPENQAVIVSLLTNDTDPDEDSLDVIAITQPALGTAVLNTDDSVTYTPPTNVSGEAVFSYTVRDPGGLEATATVTITITSVNDAPVANDDTATVAEDGSVSISVLGNDTDAENDTLTVTAVTQGTNGSVAINADQTVTYAPAANFSGTDTFTYTISDGNGGTATASVTVTITTGNDGPVTGPDSATVAEDGTVTVTVLGNDSDPENDALDVITVSQGAHGAVTLNANETVSYTPPTNYNGTDSFTYTVSDGNGGTATATVTVTITPVNDAPLALADGASVAEDGSVNVAVLGNDSDVDGDPLDVTAVTQGARGAVTLNADDTVTYAPSANFAGTDSFTYTISDGNGGTATATVTVSIVGDNDAPTASPDSATVAEDGSVSIAVLANDSDPDDDVLDVTAVTQGAHGTVTIEADGTITYEPAANYNGTDSFTYTVRDGTGGSGGTALAVVSLTVTPVNDDPVAADDQASGSEDGTVAIAVLGNDSDADDDSLTITATTQGSSGSVTVQPDQTVIYTPVANFNGTDSFTYTIEDGNGGTATATVTVSIGSENDSPVAVADGASVAEDGAVVVTVLGNDTDPENDTLDVLSVTLGANGSAVINADETVTYTPDADFHGTDSFTYTVGDGNGGTATATVTVTVTSVNDMPVVNDDAASVAEDGSVSVAVLTNDDDADGDPLTVTAVTQGANGSVTVQADQTVIYTPNANFNGTDSFTYTVADGNGGTATASVAITITSGNDGPVATPDTATVAEDGAVAVTVLTNDSDPENDPLQVTSVTQGADGTVTINAGATVTYTPDPSFHGTDSFTYTIEDGNGGTATTTVTVTVTPVNDVPVANADAGSVAEDGSVSIAVLTNDDDADGDTLSVTAVTQGANGSATVNPDKTITYAPNPNFQGSDVFTYTVSDGNGGTATASVAVTVTAVNDAPVANPNSATTPEDTPVTVAVLANDTDADGDTLQVAGVTQGAKGSVAIHPDRTVTYTPNTDVSGSDSFTYTVSDGNGGTATATVTLTISAVNDAPVAVNDTAATTAEALVNVTVLGNDVDVDGPSLTVASVTQPAHGTTVVNANQTIRYTPASGYKGSDAFTYTISDGAGGTATATVSVTVNAPPRVTGNLQVLYNFNEGSGSTVTDTSGTGTPLNLTVANPGAVSWLTGGLSVNSATLIQSAGAATKVISASQSSNAITIEAWVAPDNTSQTGPAPIVSISQASNKRNVTFGQSANRWDGRLRTTNTNQAGNTLQTAAGTVSTALSHVVYTRDSAGNVRIYVNGVQSTSSTLTGSFSAWTTTYKLGLVNELSTGSPWLGDLYLVAIYSRALSATEVRQNWLAGE